MTADMQNALIKKVVIIGRRQNWQPDIKEKKRLDRPKSEKLGC